MKFFAALIQIILFQASHSQASSVTNDILNCEANNFLKAPVCQVQTTKSDLNQICLDPVGYVCKKSPPNGAMLTAKCKVNFSDFKSTGETPEAIAVVKEIRAKETEFLTQHSSECLVTGPLCTEELRKRYLSELQHIQINTAFTQEKWAKITKLFKQVKDSAIELIKESKKLSEPNRALILKRLDQTVLRDPFRDLIQPCYLLHGNDPISGEYNEPSDTQDGVSKITVCMGTIALLDRMDESTFLISFGHELAHSIDSCSLDELFATSGGALKGSIFKSTNECLMGSKNCANTSIHCNTNAATRSFCAEQIEAKVYDTNAECMKYVAKVPNCPLSATDPTESESDYEYSSYRKGPGSVNQMQESFADFFGAEIYARYLKNQEAIDPDSNSLDRKREILTAMGTDYASLHGICLNVNTNDEHPSGKIRVMNNILGNRELSEILCPRFQGKQCEGI